MGRQLKPCGTEAAYKRHKRNGEAPCDACARAHRDGQRGRDRGVALTLLPAAEGSQDVAGDVDRLARARWALEAAEDAIRGGAPGLAGLLREHSRLVDLVASLEDVQRREATPLRAMLRGKGLA